MKRQEESRCTVNEDELNALLDGLFAGDDPNSCWVRAARLYVEGVILATYRPDEPWALKIDEGGEDGEDGQREWTN